MWVLLLFAVLLGLALYPRISTRLQSQLATGVVVVVIALQGVRGHLL